MRAISKNTRKVTALTLAAALVVAVYLNWQYAVFQISGQLLGVALFLFCGERRRFQSFLHGVHCFVVRLFCSPAGQI